MAPYLAADVDEPGSNSRKRRIDHGGAPSVDPVCVIRTNFARTGAKAMSELCPVPFPSATGAPHVVPSIETCT